MSRRWFPVLRLTAEERRALAYLGLVLALSCLGLALF